MSRWPAPEAAGAPGSGLAILVNANAKRGGRRVAAQIARELPGASVRLTKSTHEIDAWLRALPSPPRGVLAAGGDGTAIALVNALARVTPESLPLPTMGILPLGTGNGWAHALGAPKLHRCLELLARERGRLPTHRSGLVDVDGTLCHFAGAGWDAMILDDYRRQLQAMGGPGRGFSKSMYGYVSAALLRTTPKVLLVGNPRVLIENLGDEMFELGRDGRLVRLPVRCGAVIYDGTAGIASVGTCPEFGYRFKAFPFAERLPGFISVRVFARSAMGALASIPRLWRGGHPIPGMHDWLATHVRMTFSRPVPFQVGGDAWGFRRTIEYRAAARAVGMVDWRRMC
ncbi:MAG TPA: diacylglycerol kinase family protein [Polyangiaceae bacterium]|nr:diacylglycerol kinase family protein [Polyangiaceae bacterium]